MTVSRSSSAIRLFLAAVVIILAAYWAGGRWGARQPVDVGAGPISSSKPSGLTANVSERDAALTGDESINVRIYRQTAPAVANVLTKATQYDFFMDPVPVEGAGSGLLSTSAATSSRISTWCRKRNRSKWFWGTSPATRQNLLAPINATTLRY